MKRGLKILVSGSVQGVFFRANAQNIARKLNLSGVAKNLTNGRVLIIAEGEENDLDKLLEWVKLGPDLAKVVKIESQSIEATGKYNGFQIE